MNYQALSETAVGVQFGHHIDLDTHSQVMAFVQELTQRPFLGLISVSPAYSSALLVFDPFLMDKIPGKSAAESVISILKDNYGQTQQSTQAVMPSSNTHQIPVRYGGASGPDIEEVAKRTGLDVQAVIDLHSSIDYQVFMIGFLPGFPYMGILPKPLQLPRLSTPRLKVPAGTVAIAGLQTGIYPQASPGGWHLIGHTERSLFSHRHNPPSLLMPGDRVRFVPY
jgi:inhibitor of KinA